MSEAFDLHRDRGFKFYEEGKFAEAIAEWREAVRLEPDDADLYSWIGHCLGVEAEKAQDKAGWEAAAAAFQKAIDIDPTNSYAHHSLGALNWHLGKKQEAIKTLKAAIAADPNDIEAYLQLRDYQSYTRDFRGMTQTIHAIGRLPESKERDQYYANCNCFWKRIQFGFLIGIALVGVLIWNRRRRN